MSATCTTFAGTWRGVAFSRMRCRIALGERRRRATTPSRKPDEEHDPLVVVPLLPDDEALQHLVELLDLAVDLRRPDADAAGVQHRVRAPVDDEAAVRR